VGIDLQKSRGSRNVETINPINPINYKHMRNKSSNMVGQSLQINRNSIHMNLGNVIGSPKAIFRETKIEGNVLD
jgi:hypothetical protein